VCLCTRVVIGVRERRDDAGLRNMKLDLVSHRELVRQECPKVISHDEYKEEAMNKKMLVPVLTAVILMISPVVASAEGPRDEEAAGAVYTMTNDANDNEVVIFSRDEDGILTKAGSISTGGTGSGGGLDPLSRDKRWLLAVNAGSNEISVFRVVQDGLKLVDKVDSGGIFPVSLTIFHNLVYVLNAGASPNITGFSLSHRGELTPLMKSTRPLGAGGFAQVGFGPEGERLVVTDKANNNVLVYSVDRKGLSDMNPAISPSNGVTPFGFIFDQRGHLLVVEAGTNAVSSYQILRDDTLKVISPSVANGQKAACWIAGNERGYIFTANPGTHTVSAYQLRTGNGELVLLNGAAGMGNTPLDLSTTVNGRFLYALDPGNGTIDIFKVKHDGSLTNLGAINDGALSIFAQGIAVR
jgi:6-phosphogluconolactonase